MAGLKAAIRSTHPKITEEEEFSVHTALVVHYTPLSIACDVCDIQQLETKDGAGVHKPAFSQSDVIKLMEMSEQLLNGSYSVQVSLF